MYQVKIVDFAAVHGGEGGIRTHGELAPTLVFKTRSINHSDTSPFPNILSFSPVFFKKD